MSDRDILFLLAGAAGGVAAWAALYVLLCTFIEAQRKCKELLRCSEDLTPFFEIDKAAERAWLRNKSGKEDESEETQ